MNHLPLPDRLQQCAAYFQHYPPSLSHFCLTPPQISPSALSLHLTISHNLCASTIMMQTTSAEPSVAMHPRFALICRRDAGGDKSGR